MALTFRQFLGEKKINEETRNSSKRMEFKEFSKNYELNIASGSEANMTISCEMEIFNFLWLIWDHYLPLPPT